MTIEEYSKQALTTLTDEHGMQDLSPALMAQVLGLLGESGEVAEKFKKDYSRQKWAAHCRR